MPAPSVGRAWVAAVAAALRGGGAPPVGDLPPPVAGAWARVGEPLLRADPLARPSAPELGCHSVDRPCAIPSAYYEYHGELYGEMYTGGGRPQTSVDGTAFYAYGEQKGEIAKVKRETEQLGVQATQYNAAAETAAVAAAEKAKEEAREEKADEERLSAAGLEVSFLDYVTLPAVQTVKERKKELTEERKAQKEAAARPKKAPKRQIEEDEEEVESPKKRSKKGRRSL
eukprot:gene29224-18273_t